MVQSAWKSLGVSSHRRIDAVKRRFPARRLTGFLQETHLPRAAVLKVMRMKLADFERKLKEKEKLTLEESERFWRLASIFHMSVTLFDGDSEKAVQWLKSKQRALGQVAPLTHIATEPGAAEVQQLISRIEHGVIS
jgi:putative toxin-antitoxin system antitoxin component (TIGR02293 family)